MAKQGMDYIAYLLRLWRTEHSGPWKASLEDPHTGQRVGFSTVSALYAFLDQEITQVTLNQPKESDD